MPRELEDGLAALIATGRREDHTCVVITLGNGTVLRFATALLTADGHLFLPNLGESEGLKMSLTAAIDRSALKAQNVDKVLGQQITSLSNALEGATAVLAMAFQDQNHAGPVYYDPKMPGDLMAGAVDEKWVELTFVGELYGAQVVGETISSVFPYQQGSAPAQPIGNPNDLPGGGPGGSGFPDVEPTRESRIPIIDYLP